MSLGTAFNLDPQLENDSLFVTQLALCQVRLINDSQYPWFILVPSVNHCVEIIDLNDMQQQTLQKESAVLSQYIKSEFLPDKINIAAIGNKVRQLHIHHVARFITDKAWPAPIWGHSAMVAYKKTQANELITHARNNLGE